MNAPVRLVSLARQDTPWPPPGATVIDRQGMVIDISGPEWRLLHPGGSLAIRWDRLKVRDSRVLEAIKRYFAHLVTIQSARSVNNAFRAIATPLHTTAFREVMAGEGPIPFLVFSEARAEFGEKEAYRLHHWRKLYRWCTRARMPRFAREVRIKLDEQKIPGNAKGEAVRSADPNEGPLTSVEVAALVDALRGARLDRTIPVEQEAAIWLCLACGANAGPFAAMREEDLVATPSGGDGAVWTVAIPRHKKTGLVHARDEFRVRKLTGYIGRVLADLVERNRRVHPVDADDPGGRALFRTQRPRYAVDHQMAEWRWHTSPEAFSLLVKKGVEGLDVRSRTGDALQVTTRRFRYTLATRLVSSGASQRAVMDALDHTDLQHVATYFDVDNGIVDLLDQALNMVLAPRAQALMLVEREEDAIRGDEKGSRCYFSDRASGTHEPVGTCGSHSFCNVVGPLACYTCRRFQPWMDGPHQQVLDFLLGRRIERQDQGLDAKMVAIEDNVIFAVAAVIRRIDEIRAPEAANG